ncbi:MAG: HU family DNA-binding protein [Opitutaceae bacterium]|jgi:DNA-binding protein HU-beta
MNKAELVNEVHRLLGDGTSKAAAERAADSVFQAIKRGLKKDAEVHLVGFGTFTVAQRSARKGFNPHTRQPMKIPAMKLVRFKAGSNLRGGR